MRYSFLWLLSLMTFAIPAEAGNDHISLGLTSRKDLTLGLSGAFCMGKCPLGEIIANPDLLKLGVADLNLGQLLGPMVSAEALREVYEDPSAVAGWTAGRMAEDKTIAVACQKLRILDQLIPLVTKKFQVFCFWGDVTPLKNIGEALSLISRENIPDVVVLSFEHRDPAKDILPHVEGKSVFNAIVLGELELDLWQESKVEPHYLSMVLLGHWQKKEVSSHEVDEIEVDLYGPQFRHTVSGADDDGEEVNLVEPGMVGSIVFTSPQGQKSSMRYARTVWALSQKKEDE